MTDTTMTDTTNTSKRPLAITLICVLSIIGLLFAIGAVAALAFLPADIAGASLGVGALTQEVMTMDDVLSLTRLYNNRVIDVDGAIWTSRGGALAAMIVLNDTRIALIGME
jgi:hypothetical protein